MAEFHVLPNERLASHKLEPSLDRSSTAGTQSATLMTVASSELTKAVGTLAQRVGELERTVVAMQRGEDVARDRLEEYFRYECAAILRASENLRRWLDLAWTVILVAAVAVLATGMAFYALTVFNPFEGRYEQAHSILCKPPLRLWRRVRLMVFANP